MSVQNLPTPADSSSPAFTGRLLLGVDLTTTGAKAPLHRRSSAGTGQRVSLGDVADYVALSRDAGAELVTFGESFRLDDAPRNDAWLDPAVIASRLAAAGLLDGGQRVVSALPGGFLDPMRLARAIAGIHARSGGRAGWQLPTSTTSGGVHAEVRRVWSLTPEARTGGRAPLLVTAPTDPATAVVAGRWSDVVRLRVTDVAEARRRRLAIRTAAEQAGRNPDDVRVVVDAVTVISDDAASALFRADLLRDLGTVEGPEPLTVAGTGGGVADVLQEWVEADAADGFVVLPGSLPTDVLAIAGSLAPELRERGLLAPADPVVAEARVGGAALSLPELV